MARAAFALAAVGLGVAALAVFAMAPARESPPAAPPPQPAVQPRDTAPAARRLPAGPVDAPASGVRPVAPDIVAHPQVAPGELERIEPRRPLSPQAAPTRRKKNHGMIFTPVVEAAGRLSGSGLTIRLAGIEATEPERTCTDKAGVEWPCGLRARAAFRAFVRGRALACDLPDELDEESYTTACTLGPQDPAAWLVSQGWAAASPGGPYEAAGAAARAAGKGIHGAAPLIEPLPHIPALPE